ADRSERREEHGRRARAHPALAGHGRQVLLRVESGGAGPGLPADQPRAANAIPDRLLLLTEGGELGVPQDLDQRAGRGHGRRASAALSRAASGGILHVEAGVIPASSFKFRVSKSRSVSSASRTRKSKALPLDSVAAATSLGVTTSRMESFGSLVSA